MPFLSRLFGKRAPEYTERISSTTAGKIDDLVAQVRQCLASGAVPVTVVHFRATRQRLMQAVEESGLSARVVESAPEFPADFSDVPRPGAPILMLLSEAIPSWRGEPSHVRRGVSVPPIAVHLAEHYPTPDRDRHVLGLEARWSRPITFTCYSALDEPLLALFAGERVRDLLARLGMNEHTVLSHPALQQAIRSAQEKIARQVRHEQRSDSCDEWIRCNLPRRTG